MTPTVLNSTRTRVLAAALGLVAATIVISVLANRAVLLNRLDDRVERDLVQEVDEFRQVASAINPVTSEPFGDDVEAIFDTFLDQNVPADDEIFVTISGGEPYLRSANPMYRVEQIPGLLESWGQASEPTLTSVDTPEGELRVLIVPVTNSEDATAGTFVVGQFLRAERSEVDEANRVAAIVGGAAFLLASLAAWSIAGKVLAPLRQLSDAAARIDEHDLGHRIDVVGGGELAELSTRFNAMLDRVDRAFASQRSFLDDASHELRTPITVIQGHLELTEADEPLPASTRLLLLDELERMDRIVEDLLTVAKADRPDFVILGPVDIADLTIEVADKARALADRRWTSRLDALLVTPLDRQRVVQAWMNLARNAAQHSDDGSEVEIFSQTVGDTLELGVADHGEGVDPEDRERIFGRFSRGLSTRRTRADGAGLGLAITSSIAEAHGGRIEVRDTPGGGATFVMVFPLAAADLPAVEPEHETTDAPETTSSSTDLSADDITEEPWPAS